MWILCLNDMRSSKIEHKTIFARADKKEELQAFLEKEKAPSTWRDGTWGKTFKEGSILEWANPPYSDDKAFVDLGTREEWIEKAKKEYDALLFEYPQVY